MGTLLLRIRGQLEKPILGRTVIKALKSDIEDNVVDAALKKRLLEHVEYLEKCRSFTGPEGPRIRGYMYPTPLLPVGTRLHIFPPDLWEFDPLLDKILEDVWNSFGWEERSECK